MNKLKEICLTRGDVALVDDEDYDRVSQYKWHSNPHGRTTYAQRTDRSGDQRTTELLHRFILRTSAEDLVDHIDGDGLNNTRSNLRLATHSQNMKNRRKHRNNKSGYTGVHWNKTNQRWRARIKAEGKSIHLGYFVDAEEAAQARDRAAAELHGDFMRETFSSK